MYIYVILLLSFMVSKNSDFFFIFWAFSLLFPASCYLFNFFPHFTQVKIYMSATKQRNEKKNKYDRVTNFFILLQQN